MLLITGIIAAAVTAHFIMKQILQLLCDNFDESEGTSLNVPLNSGNGVTDAENKARGVS